MKPFPLHWPPARKRTVIRSTSRFKSPSVDKATTAVFDELEKWGVRDYDVCLSSDIPLRRDGRPRSDDSVRITDHGIAVYFRRKGKDYMLCCDKWRNAADNIWAIAKHLDTLRGQERWGVETADSALSHYLALPERGSGVPWWEVLEVSSTPTTEEVRASFRKKSLTAHPDRGGSTAEWELLNNANQQADAYFAGQALVL